MTGFADQSDNLQQTPTPTVELPNIQRQHATPTPTASTPTPTPIPMACPTGTVFDVTLQAVLGRSPSRNSIVSEYSWH